MEKVFKYLEFLLPLHNCVVVPDLGGFILNLEPAHINAEGRLLPPAFRVVFNQELTHNDGILISRFIKDDNISHNVASMRIKDLVKNLKNDLEAGKTVACGSLGVLSLNEEGNILFVANNWVHPDLFGLTQIGLRRFVDIDKTLRSVRKHLLLRYAAGGVAAVAAALFLFVVPSVNIIDRSHSSQVQQANFIETLTRSFVSSKGESDSTMFNVTESPNGQVTSKSELVGDIKQPSVRVYYVVIGGEDSKSRAERLLDKIKASDFQNAAIVESGERYRVYVASFTDRAEGETFLETFRKEHPKYETAWLYSQRNR